MSKMMKALFVVLCFASWLTYAHGATPFEEKVNYLLGVWFTGEKVAGNAWVLRVTNIPFASSQAAKVVAYAGVAGGRWTEPASGVAARLEGVDGIRVEFEPRPGWTVQLSMAGTDALTGTAISADGSRHPLTLRRSSVPDVHRWIAENPSPDARASGGSTVQLVYISASDCDWCRAWESEHLDEGRGKFKGTAEWKAIDFTEMKRGSFRGPLAVGDVPPPMHAAFTALKKARSSVFFVTPSYVVLVDGNVRVHGAGTSTFETLVRPAIRAALREKAASGN